jgi:hypothetical protein
MGCGVTIKTTADQFDHTRQGSSTFLTHAEVPQVGQLWIYVLTGFDQGCMFSHSALHDHTQGEAGFWFNSPGSPTFPTHVEVPQVG